jgi:3-methyl-2-oxobutanoate hydroxymethyltransferase
VAELSTAHCLNKQTGRVEAKAPGPQQISAVVERIDMSKAGTISRVTTRSFFRKKKKAEKIVVLTAYDAMFARFEDEAGVDCILVGDSVGMVYGGNDTTLSVTVEQMVYHSASVSRGVSRAMVVSDMPFLSVQGSHEEALSNCGRMLSEGGANAVKIEGGTHMAATIKFLTDRGIPVMGHLGLVPQSINKLGGYGTRGRSSKEAESIFEDAKLLQESGCFSIVLEKVEASLAARITEELKIPTIGIGSGNTCDGQVLVVMDMLGLYEDFKPGFVRHFAQLAKPVKDAIADYANEVRSGGFPNKSEI